LARARAARYHRRKLCQKLEKIMSIEAPETVVVTQSRVACEGSGGALGHPRVYLEMGEAGFVECGYCDRRFVLSPAALEARAKGEAEAH
jgi:uncharacterized Zn-finger protein